MLKNLKFSLLGTQYVVPDRVLPQLFILPFHYRCQKVLFLIHKEGNHLPTSLLKFRLEDYFNSLPESIKDNIVIIERNLNERNAFEEILTEHPDHHVFVDEARFGGSINYASLISWSQIISEEKHFWISICYGKETFEKGQLEIYFLIPIMKYPLRNNRDTIELVKSQIGK